MQVYVAAQRDAGYEESMGMFSSTNRGREGGASQLPPAPAYEEERPNLHRRPAASVIGADVTITGHVAATAELQIDGRVDGDVTCTSLGQGAESRIKGAVQAENARLAGTVEGAVTVRNLAIERTAQIIGDVAYETIAIENGAHIDGRLKHATSVPRDVAPDQRPDDGIRLVS